MRMEDISKQCLAEANDQELRTLRYKFAKFWDNHFEHNSRKVVGCFTRVGFVAKYRLLLKEMDSPRRSLEHSTCDIDRKAFAQSMETKQVGIDVTQLTQFVTGKNCIILDKDFVEADELKITIQQDTNEPDEQLEQDLTEMLSEQFDKSCVFTYEQNFEGEGIPLFHEVLQPVEKIEKITLENEEGDEAIEKDIIIIPIEKGDERIVYGIVYQPDTPDAQNDQANAEEIKKAAYNFMEHVLTFKVMHKGKRVKVKILENYIAPVDFTIEKRKIKKGSWILVTRVLDKQLWKEIKAGRVTGYSMAGYAKAD